MESWPNVRNVQNSVKILPLFNEPLYPKEHRIVLVLLIGMVQGDSFGTRPKKMRISQRLLYVFFWVFPRRPIVVCRRFGTLYQFHLQGLDVEYEVKTIH